MRKVILAFSIILIHSYSCLGFELIVLGDSRSGSGNESFQRTSEIINDAIEYTEKNYDELIGIIMTGDYVGRRKNVDEWEKWREAAEKVFKYPVFESPTIMPGLKMEIGSFDFFTSNSLSYLLSS